ncbi:yhl026c-like protein [Colletotrichum incanum]|uniref:Yhl026c-like protein n=1 Tax=Colletotrichum incanum TaxID=1573173 RepID=A0A166R0R1_COLIC|nr:yhl026c-like protein [Colletotrichum incanum]
MPFWKHEQIVEKSFEGRTTLPRHASGVDGGDLETGEPELPYSRHEKQPTDRITGHQIFYIFGLDGVGAAILSGGINFALAYGMYSTQNVELHPIRLFQLPNTLAGDAVVTMLIQTVVTWFIELIMVEHDMKSGAIRPIGFIREPSHPLVRWLMLLDRKQTMHSKSRTVSLTEHAIRVVSIFVVSFLLLWPASIGILTTIGERTGNGDWDWYFQREWAPQAYKAVLGGLLSLLTTPAMASFWLVREGWRLRRGGAFLS